MSSLGFCLKTELPKDWDQGIFASTDWDKVLVKNPVLKRVLDKVNYSERIASWHKDHNQIDWEAETTRSQCLLLR
jgi:hypothetical protein